MFVGLEPLDTAEFITWKMQRNYLMRERKFMKA